MAPEGLPERRCGAAAAAGPRRGRASVPCPQVPASSCCTAATPCCCPATRARERPWSRRPPPPGGRPQPSPARCPRSSTACVAVSGVARRRQDGRHRARDRRTWTHRDHARQARGQQAASDRGINFPTPTWQAPGAHQPDIAHLAVRGAAGRPRRPVVRAVPRGRARAASRLRALGGEHLGVVLKIETQSASGDLVDSLSWHRGCAPGSPV